MKIKTFDIWMRFISVLYGGEMYGSPLYRRVVISFSVCVLVQCKPYCTEWDGKYCAVGNIGSIL